MNMGVKSSFSFDFLEHFLHFLLDIFDILNVLSLILLIILLLLIVTLFNLRFDQGDKLFFYHVAHLCFVGFLAIVDLVVAWTCDIEFYLCLFN